MTNLDKIREAYVRASHDQPSKYPVMPAWEALPLALREVIIHIWHDDHRVGTQEEIARR
jgi:hypothetical protein